MGIPAPQILEVGLEAAMPRRYPYEQTPTSEATLVTRPRMQAISPFFIVSNVDQTMAFYCDKLGFEARFQEPSQNPFFAIIGREGAQLFVKSDKDVLPLPNHRRHPFMRWDAYVYAPDPDALAAEFADQGVTFSAPLEDTHDGLRGFEISDPDGYILFFGRPRQPEP
jgi:catechol 2,3-dioxygenase-like lactoylglutathione lyase family enzyme